MDQCNVEIDARQSGVVPGAGGHSATPISEPSRGLELIKSCAKFYANGVAAANPTVQPSYPTGSALKQPAPAPSGVVKVNISSVAAICLCLVVLPSLALTAIVWWGVTAQAAKGREEAPGYASAMSAQAASQGLRPPRSLQEATGAQTVLNAQSDIVIHKVKTQPIAAGAWGVPNRDDRSSEISATD
jgi:hypothetical protein